MEILYEDEWLIAVNKPAQMHSVAHPGDQGESVAAWLALHDPAFLKSGPAPQESGLLHRLDYATSGVIVAARAPNAWEALAASVRGGESTKSYLAVVHGVLPREVEVNTYIGARYRRSAKVEIFPNKRARALPAHTELAPHRAAPCGCSIIRATIRKGRRHQIRAHLAHIGMPLVGDALYGSKMQLGDLVARGVERMMPRLPDFILHCHVLKVEHPVHASPLHLEAPAPEYLMQLMQ